MPRRPRSPEAAIPDYCGYDCPHANFPPADTAGICRTMSAVWCGRLCELVNKNAPCEWKRRCGDTAAAASPGGHAAHNAADPAGGRRPRRSDAPAPHRRSAPKQARRAPAAANQRVGRERQRTGKGSPDAGGATASPGGRRRPTRADGTSRPRGAPRAATDRDAQSGTGS